MIAFDRALELVLEHAPAPEGEESIPLASARGRVLARDIHSDVDMPPFDKAMMDGFAVRSCDLSKEGGELELVGEARAGLAFEGEVAPGTAVRIMTGAPLPRGADAVAIVESSERVGEDRVRIHAGVAPGENAVERGCDLRVGERVLARGHLLGAAELAALATVGCAKVPVHPRLRVHCMATGDELVPPDRSPGPGQIRDSNSSAMLAQLDGARVVARSFERASDDPEDLRRRILEALEECDALLLSGGVSMGEYDLVGRTLLEIGVRQVFHKIRLKPGKPVWFGVLEAEGRAPRLVFGLPGNPVSSFATTEALVRPALEKMSGLAPRAIRRRGRLDAGFPIRPNKRLQLLPARTRQEGVETRLEILEWSSSADHVELVHADAFAVVPEESAPGIGQIVEYLPFRLA